MKTQKLIQIMKDMAAALKENEFGLIAFGTTSLSTLEDLGLHISEDKMEEFAPLAKWTLNVSRGTEDASPYPFQHFVIIDDVRVFCITKERIGVA
jgi:hypothetical protein